MGFEFFGMGKKKTVETEESAEIVAPAKTAEEMQAYAEEQGFAGKPAEFSVPQDLDRDPSVIDDEASSVQGFARNDIWAVGEAKHLPKIDRDSRV